MGEQHEKELREEIERLKNEGYRVIDLERKCPDAIAIKPNNVEVCAVEILSMSYNYGIKGYKAKWTVKAKKTIYHMFDKVIIKVFKLPRKIDIDNIKNMK